MSILDGLDSLGLGNLSDLEVYGNKDNKIQAVVSEKEAKIARELNEAEMLFNKSYVCPVCDNNFKSLTVKSGKTRILSTDIDLRPCFDGIEPLKYEPVVCEKCGFASTARYFGPLPSVHRKMILENISVNYKSHGYGDTTYSYEEALERYKLVLANTVVKHGKASEKAYTCLKAGWLVRSYIEELNKETVKDDGLIQNMSSLEKEFMTNAYEGYMTAVLEEKFPMCGMDEQTVNYLLAALAMSLEHYDVCGKLVSEIIVSKSANSRIKDKARDLKQELIARLKGNS